jgi:hypothetical protein
VYDVRRSPFNAVGDGVADDTTAIQAALDAAETAGGGIVHVPKGSWLTSGLALGSFVTLRGDGRATQLVHKTNSTTHLISNKALTTEQFTVRDINLNGAPHQPDERRRRHPLRSHRLHERPAALPGDERLHPERQEHRALRQFLHRVQRLREHHDLFL